MANSVELDQLVGFRSQQIWLYTICNGRVYPGSAGLGLNVRLIVFALLMVEFLDSAFG